jgi:hypothetical protein
MNPHPDLTYRTETLAAEQNRRAIELRRVIHERTGESASRSIRSRFSALRRRARVATSAPEATAAPRPGTHAHA